MKRILSSVLGVAAAALLLTLVISVGETGAANMAGASLRTAVGAQALEAFWEEDFSAFDPTSYFSYGTSSGVVNDEYFQLTPDAASQRGRIFYRKPASMYAFTATFKLYLGGNDGGADGAAFIFCPLYDYPEGAGSSLDAGCSGGYLVAYDTWGQSGDLIYVAQDDTSNVLQTANVPNLEDGNWHTSTVAFSQGTITVTLDGSNVITGFNLPGFNPFDGYFGFSAATGGLSNEHRLDEIEVRTVLPPAAGIRYVKPNGGGDCTAWEQACALQLALSSGGEIWVAEGLYRPTTGFDREATFRLAAGVSLYGGFAGTETSRDQRDWQSNVTVLSGDIGGDDQTDANGVVTTTAHINGSNAYHVVTVGSEVTQTAVLDGFTITAGQADGSHSAVQTGGGIYNESGTLTMSNSILSGNTAEIYGGGMFSGYGSTLTTTNSTLSGNTAGYYGGGINNSGTTTLINSDLSGNMAAFGGGIFNLFGPLTITNSSLSGNTTSSSGGGIYNYYGTLTISNSSLRSNEADSAGGGISSFGGTTTLINSGLSGNMADSAGGIFNLGTFYVTNSTLSGNTAELNGGGVLNHCIEPLPGELMCGSIYLANSILWANSAITGTQLFHHPNATTIISFSDINDSGGSSSWDSSLGTDGGGNIDADPLLVRIPDPGDGDWSTPLDNDYGDLRLQLTSPAIDAGDNDAVPAGVTTDLEGRPRFVDIVEVPDTGSGTPPIVDMGAYEADYYGIYLPVIVR